MQTTVRTVIFLLTVCCAYGQQYFPPEFKSQGYSDYLRALREPSLWETSKRDVLAEEYRFLYLRSFRYHPISVRLVLNPDKTATLISKETGGQSGKPGRLIRNRKTYLAKLQTEAFLTALKDLSFWNLPTVLVENNDVVQLDGAQWILEGVKQGRYHIVDRWSPGRMNDPVKIIGTKLIDLAHFKYSDRDGY
jgi:hypothetical protein